MLYWLVLDPSWFQWLALFGGGLVCGFLNTLAGGGSIITLPLLIFLGLSSKEANATNRFALSFQYLAAVIGFWRSGMLPTHSFSRFLVPGLVGCLAGTAMAVIISPLIFKKLLAIVLLLASIPLWVGKEWFSPKETQWKQQKPLEFLAFFGIGFYSGFIQVGVGIWTLLLLLSLGGLGARDANIMKSQALFVFVAFSALLFLFTDLIHFKMGLFLALSTSIGSLLGTRWVLRGDPKWLKGIIIGVVFLSSLKMLEIW